MKKREFFERIKAKMNVIAEIIRSDEFCVMGFRGGRIRTVKGWLPEEYHKEVVSCAEDIEVLRSREGREKIDKR